MQSRLSLSFLVLVSIALSITNGCGGTADYTPRPSAALEPQEPANTSELGSSIGTIDARILGSHKTGYPVLIKLHINEHGVITKTSTESQLAYSLPPALAAVAHKEFPDSDIEKIETEVYLGEGTVYEAHLITKDGNKCEMSMNNNGLVRYVKCDIPPKALPKEVTLTLAKAFPTGSATEASEEIKPAPGAYCVKVNANNAVHALRIKKNGEIAKHAIHIPAWIDISAPLEGSRK